MSYGKMLPKLLSYTIPLMLSGILQLAFNAADLIVAGRFGGDTALAAVGSNGPLVTLIVNVLVGIGTGVSVLVARYYGAKDAKSMKETVQTAMLCAFYGGIIIAVAGFFISGPLLRLMGTPAEVEPLAARYLKIYFCGMPIIAVYNFASAVLRSVGDTKRPLIYLTIAGFINVGLNLFFVLVFDMPVEGVAIATVTSQIVSGYLTLRCLIKTDAIYKLELKGMRFSMAQFKIIARIGIPAGLQGSVFSVANVLVQSSINSFGAAVMAGASAAGNIENFIFCAQNAFSQSAVTAVSQNFGAREYERTKKAVYLCIALAATVSVILSVVSFLFRYELIGIYTSDAEAIAAGVKRFSIIATSFFMGAIMDVLSGALRGHGYGVLPTVISFTGCCAFRVVWLYTVFAAHHTMFTLFIIYPISWIMTAIVSGSCYFALRNKAFEKNERQYLKKEN